MVSFHPDVLLTSALDDPRYCSRVISRALVVQHMCVHSIQLRWRPRPTSLAFQYRRDRFYSQHKLTFKAAGCPSSQTGYSVSFVEPPVLHIFDSWSSCIQCHVVDISYDFGGLWIHQRSAVKNVQNGGGPMIWLCSDQITTVNCPHILGKTCNRAIL